MSQKVQTVMLTKIIAEDSLTKQKYAVDNRNFESLCHSVFRESHLRSDVHYTLIGGYVIVREGLLVTKHIPLETAIDVINRTVLGSCSTKLKLHTPRAIVKEEIEDGSN